MKVSIIQHESFEAPGAITAWIQDRHHTREVFRQHLGEKCDPSVVDADLLIVLGGPQCPATTTKECAHFDAESELVLIRNYIAHGRAVLGVCLGAQLIGQALGAEFDHSPQREIGVFPVALTEAGKADPCFKDLPHVFQVGHWHGDMPGLTPESEVLATSEGCPRQIVRYRPNVYGFQCHFEFTSEAVDGMIEHCGDELDRYRGQPFIETPVQLRSHDYSEMNEMLFHFLDYIESIQVEGDRKVASMGA